MACRARESTASPTTLIALLKAGLRMDQEKMARNAPRDQRAGHKNCIAPAQPWAGQWTKVGKGLDEP